MHDNYIPIKASNGIAFVRKEKRDAFKFDSIAFDCDGVLLDARNSYDRTIVLTLNKLIAMIFHIRVAWDDKIPRLIYSLRSTGSFNNDWDTTYALLLFSSSFLARRFKAKLDSVSKDVLKLDRNESANLFSSLENYVEKFISFNYKLGYSSVDQFIGSFSKQESHFCEKVRDLVRYPGTPPYSLLASVFDEIYYGPRLYKEAYGQEPRYYRGRGYIENDRLLVKKSSIVKLNNIFNRKIAIVTGRPYRATEYSLKSMIQYFNIGASVFIGDADRREELSYLKSFKKPSPLSLLYAKEKLSSRSLLYVADSAEDLRMVQAAKESGQFCLAGVYGSSLDPERQRLFFMENDTELIIPSVNILPDLIKVING